MSVRIRFVGSGDAFGSGKIIAYTGDGEFTEDMAQIGRGAKWLEPESLCCEHLINLYRFHVDAIG